MPTWDAETATRKLGPFDPAIRKRGRCLTCNRSLWSAWNHLCSNPTHEVEVTAVEPVTRPASRLT
jgi:hypothetical protein